MKVAPTIHFDEFSNYTTESGVENDFETRTRVHPEFGRWSEKLIDLNHFRIYQHRGDLKRNVNVLFDDGSLDKYVHHCMSIEGEMAANFTDFNFCAHLSPRSFHNMFVPNHTYFLGMGSQFVNVHIEVDKDYYAQLLPDTESWSAQLKNDIQNNTLYYPGEFRLSAQMLHTIQTIFNSALSGALKKLLIEAKVQELLALQLHGTLHVPCGTDKPKDLDLFISIRQYLDQTFLDDHSLKNISKHFGINEFRLKKGFRDAFGTTVFDYLLSRRLEYSLQLLKDTQQSISEISTSVGYNYPNHFSAAFKKKFGYNPAAWRKSS